MLYKLPMENLLADNITFVVTDDCNLRCRYCYEKNKVINDMTIETALKGVDYFFDIWKNRQKKVVIDFIGGEPFVRIDLLEKVVPYIIEKFNNSKKWEMLTLAFSTNGTRFCDKRVRDFIAKYKNYIAVSLSLDGCKEIHDYNRNNSFDEVMAYFPYWRSNFPHESIKSTLNHESIPYLFESIKFLESTCLEYMYMNTIYENVWEKDDDKLFYEQLIKSADYIIDNNLYKDKFCSLFDMSMLLTVKEKQNWCGCGASMIAMDYQGNLYPCLRFKTLSKQNPLIIGNIYENNGKIDYKKLLPFYFCHNVKNSPDCEHCEAYVSCPNCTAFCYDETGSIFDRVNYMCDMHKARYKANIYYWNKLAKKENVTVDDLAKDKKGNELYYVSLPKFDKKCRVCYDLIPDINNIQHHDIVSRYDKGVE